MVSGRLYILKSQDSDPTLCLAAVDPQYLEMCCSELSLFISVTRGKQNGLRFLPNWVWLYILVRMKSDCESKKHKTTVI